MGTLSLRNGPLLTQPQAGIEHGLPLATSIQVQLHHQGPDFKLGCAGWETFKSRRSVTSTRARTAARGTRASIGFTADPRVKIERAATALLKDAAMLLVYQDVLKAAPAQAFLRVLLALRRADDGLKLLETYGEFFRLMAMSRSPSWEDFLLDGILAGESNPFAEAASNAGNPRSPWSGSIPPALRAAAASDLDSLQRLNVSESTLSGWVAEVVADTRPEWRSAAAATLSSRSVAKPQSSATESSRTFGFATNDEERERDHEREADAVSSVVDSQHMNGACATTAANQTEQRDSLSVDREKWRKKIGGLWKWSEAVPLLEEYYSEHGFSRLVSTQVFHWKGGKLARDTKPLARHRACELTAQTDQRNALLQELRKHAKGSPVQHILLCGPSGSGKSWLLGHALHEVAYENGLRIVFFPSTEMRSLGQLLEELGRYWKTRFALVMDDPFSRGGEENMSLLKTALDGGLQEWPENVLLCVSSVKALSDGDLKLFFGKPIHLKNLDRSEYVSTVTELLEDYTKSLPSPSRSLEDVRSEADAQYTELAKTVGGDAETAVASVRHAAHFAKSVAM